MKKFISTLVFCCAFISSSVLAHADHGLLGSANAIDVATKTVQKMTFKDLGYKVGKLGESWKSNDNVQYSIFQQTPDYFIIQAANKIEKNSILIKVGNGRQVIGVTSGE